MKKRIDKINNTIKTINLLDKILYVFTLKKTYCIFFIICILIVSILLYRDYNALYTIDNLESRISYLIITNDNLIILTNTMYKTIQYQSNKIIQLNEFSNSSFKLMRMENYKLSDSNAEIFNDINFDYIGFFNNEITNIIQNDTNNIISNDI